MPTQKELAKLAGVSAGTVSNVISGAVPVSERARTKVMEAVKTLGYQPNLIARSLRLNRTYTLGMVVPDLTVPFFSKVIRGAESAARESGYFLVLLDAESNVERQAEMLLLLQAQRVEGIVLITSAGETRDEQSRTIELPDLPTVYLDRLPYHLKTDSVRINDPAAAQLGMNHLISQGYKRIVIVTGPMSLRNERERLRGCRDAMRKAKIAVEDALIWTAGLQNDEVARLCYEKLTTMKKRPAAIFATNGVTGLGVLRGAYRAGLKTPQDFAFVSFDELTSENFFEPAVTSVVQPAFEIGYRGVKMLVGRLNGAESGEPRTVRLEASLHIRESSKHAANRDGL